MIKILLFMLFIDISNIASAATIEVLHYWTSESERASVGLLKQALSLKGDIWQDFTVVGGGGESAYSVLQARTISGNPPTAALMEGKTLQEWAQLGFLSSPYTKKQTEQWDQVLPPVIRHITKYHGEYMAVPINIHRINWLYINPKPFHVLGIDIPSNWNELLSAAKKLKEAGYIPLANGGQSWQEAAMFENLLLGTQGEKFYRQVFIHQDKEAITSERMIAVLKIFRRLHNYIDTNANGRSWPESVKLLMSGRAAMMIMGDWAKGELMQMGSKPGKDFLCIPTPGTAGYFIYNTDSFAILQQNGDLQAVEAQRHLADVLMDRNFQKRFNQVKGSIPARNDVDMSGFDLCAQQSAKAFFEAENTHHLLPSMAHSMAVDAQKKEVFFRVLNDFFTHPSQDPRQVVKQLNAGLMAMKN